MKRRIYDRVYMRLYRVVVKNMETTIPFRAEGLGGMERKCHPICSRGLSEKLAEACRVL